MASRLAPLPTRSGARKQTEMRTLVSRSLLTIALIKQVATTRYHG
jgi:hypothetical protein